MSILWLAAICAALGIGCLLTPWHIGMTGVCLLLLAAVLLGMPFPARREGQTLAGGCCGASRRSERRSCSA